MAVEKKEDHKVVKHAELHSDVRFGGLTLTTLNHAKAPGIKMVWIKSEGLVLSFKGRSIFVPSTNVKFIEFES